jgi:pimeloyl-ACP methyl ester carboxylesterase
VPDVSDHEGELDGRPVFWRSASLEAGANGASSAAHAQAHGSDAVPLYVHGVPDNSDAWLEFLAHSGGLAPDLPGFGRSGKPGSLKYTIEEYADFLEAFLELVGVERVKLVMHDWGAVGLAFAQRHPERVERLVVIDVVPFLPGYRWHRTARMWRTPLIGELSMGTISKRVLSLISRESNATPGPMPDVWQQSVLAHFDQGTQRAILRLYRSSPPEVLVQAGARLGELDMPALVVWGAKDPYLPPRFGRAYAEVLPNAELLELPDAGHWVWFDRPDVIERVVEFLARDPE